MSNDELYYDSLTDLAERVARGLLNRSQPLSDLSQVMSLLAGTDTIKGQGADAMRAYIGEVHAPLNQAIQQAIENFRMGALFNPGDTIVTLRSDHEVEGFQRMDKFYWDKDIDISEVEIIPVKEPINLSQFLPKNAD
ncbi:hypothetical protein [Lactovum odontotermitis]